MKLPRSHAPRGSARRGSVLALVLVSVLTVAAVCAALLQLNAAVTRRQSAATHRGLALYMAEAGLAEAYAGLTLGKTGNVGTPARPAVFGEGLFWVVATDNGDDTVTLESTALVGSGQAVLSLVAARGDSTVASMGIFSGGALEVGPGSLVDGYDGEEGTYRSQKNPDPTLPPPPATPGRLGANAAIRVSGTEDEPTLVDGSVTPGPGLTVLSEGTVEITGSTRAARAATELLPVVVPGFAALEGIDLEAGAPLLLLPGETGVEYITVRDGAELIFVGPATFEVGDLRVETGGSLEFETTDGAVDLFVTDTLVLEAGAAVATSSLDTTRATIQVAGAPREPVRLAAKGRFYGVIYAPAATVEITNEFKVFGAAVAQDLQLGAGAKLHFDVRLDRAARERVLPKSLSWRIVELSSAASATGDPFRFLGLDPATLPRPADAHADQTLVVEYLDQALVPRTYEGLESAFDWSQVSDASFVARDGEPVVETKAAKKDLVTRSLEDPTIASFDLKRVLKTHSPLEEAQLVEAIRRTPDMTSPDLLEVLDFNRPLSEFVLLKATRDDLLSSGDLATLLLASMPLPANVMDAARTRSTPMTAGDLNAVQTAQDSF
jgi:hypothetical protein